jgi:predicted nuclease with RNAse H fold
VARLLCSPERAGEAWVEEVSTRRRTARGDEPWHDEALVSYIEGLGAQDRIVIAVDAPLTLPACLRCQVPVCPGAAACEVPATAWLRTAGADLMSAALVRDRDRIAAIPSASGFASHPSADHPVSRSPLAPYTHRCTEVLLHYSRDVVPREMLGRGLGPIAARGAHLRRVLGGSGFALNQNLIEVSPRGTVHALFGARKARGYKRDADPWETRAAIIEDLSADVRFSPTSCLAREEVLQNDHCFDALLAGYTAFLWARDGWEMPGAGEPFAEDGWIWVPPER